MGRITVGIVFLSAGEPGDEDPDLVEDDHGDCHHALREGVRRGRDDGRHDEADHDRVAAHPRELAGRHQADLCHEEEEDGDLEDDPEGEQQFQREREVLPHGEHGLEEVRGEFQKELVRPGEHQEVAEAHPADEEKRRGDHERGYEFLFLREEARRDELPDLVEHNGAGDEDARVERYLDVGEKGLGEPRVDHVAAGRQYADQRLCDNPEDLLLEGKTPEKRNADGDQDADEPLSQLLQVGGEGHLVFVFGSVIIKKNGEGQKAKGLW